MNDNVWTEEQAISQFDDLIARAMSYGPQVITRKGHPLVQVVATDQDDGFGEYLLSSPKLESDQELIPPRTKPSAKR